MTRPSSTAVVTTSQRARFLATYLILGTRLASKETNNIPSLHDGVYKK